MTHKKLFQFLTLSLFVVLVLFAPLAAQDDNQKKACCEKMKAAGCEKKMQAEGCMMMCSQLPNLTAEQKAKLEKLHAEHQKMMADAKAEMEKQALEMKGLMKDPVDVKKIEAKIDELSKLHADMQKKCLAHRLAVRGLLTDEQKVKFDSMGCGMMMGGIGCKAGMAHKGCCATEGCKMMHGMKMEAKKCPMHKEAKEEEKK
jgi:Spy/CpxP family protein refolding chaperone